MPHSQSSTAEAFTRVEREQNTASDGASISSALSLAARREFLNETQRRRQLLRSSARHNHERDLDGLPEPSQRASEQIQASNTNNASLPLVGPLGTPASPTFELAPEPEHEFDFILMGDPELLGRQPNASAYLPSFRRGSSPPSVASGDGSPAVTFHQDASADDLIDDRAPMYYNFPGSWSPESFASEALPAFHPSYEYRRSHMPSVDQWSHRDGLRDLGLDFATLQDANRLLRDARRHSRQESDRQSLIVAPSMAPTNNSDNAHMLPQLIPSVQFYPAGEIRRYSSSRSHQEFSTSAKASYRPEDNLNHAALESGVGEINQYAGSGSSIADRDIADVDGAMVEHVEDIRNHRLPRYYELMGAYSYVLHRWCQQVHHQVTNTARCIRHPTSSLERMPTIQSTFWDIGRHFLSQDHHRIATAVQHIQKFLLCWSENRGPAYQILQPIAEAPLLEEFARLLLQEGMEQERMVWEPVVKLHTGRRLNSLLLAYENLRLVSRQRNTARFPIEESTDEDQVGFIMDVVDGIRPYRYLS